MRNSTRLEAGGGEEGSKGASTVEELEVRTSELVSGEYKAMEGNGEQGRRTSQKGSEKKKFDAGHIPLKCSQIALPVHRKLASEMGKAEGSKQQVQQELRARREEHLALGRNQHLKGGGRSC